MRVGVEHPKEKPFLQSSLFALVLKRDVLPRDLSSTW